jgi:hypothetical protein
MHRRTVVRPHDNFRPCCQAVFWGLQPTRVTLIAFSPRQDAVFLGPVLERYVREHDHRLPCRTSICGIE